MSGRGSDFESLAQAALDRKDHREVLLLLMDAYGDAVYHFCRRQLRDEHLAEDVRQQSFAQAFEDLPRFSRRSSLRTWLFGIAHHRCQDTLKARRRFDARVETSDRLPDAQDDAPLQDVRLEEARRAQAVADCLEGLAPAARAAVGLRFTHGFTFEQMATICGEKATTLQARVARALPALRQCLENRGVTYVE